MDNDDAGSDSFDDGSNDDDFPGPETTTVSVAGTGSDEWLRNLNDEGWEKLGRRSSFLTRR